MINSPNTVLVRLGESADIEAASALLEAQLREHVLPISAGGARPVIERLVADSRLGFMLLALAEGAPVGVAFAAAHLSLEYGGMIGWLEELYVVPARRNGEMACD